MMLHLKEFSRETSLGGFPEIAKRTPLLEKFVWIISVTCCCLMSLYLIASTLIKFQDNPTIKSEIIGEMDDVIYIPAVTICREIPQNETRLDQVIQRLWGKTSNENYSYYKNFLRNVTNFSYRNVEAFLNFQDDGILPQDGYLEITNEVKQDILLKAESELDIYSNHWKSMISDFGLCMCWGCVYTLPEDWRNRSLMIPELDDFLIEVHMKKSSSLIFHNIEENDKVYIHKPTDLPKFNHPNTVIKGFTTLFDQQPFIIKEDESIKTLSISQRKCRFHHENNLKMFGWYSYEGCLMECRYNLTIKLCGCSPHVYSQNDENACTLAGLQCLARYKDLLLDPVNVENSQCNCLPLCGEIELRNILRRVTPKFGKQRRFIMSIDHSYLKPVVYYHTVAFSTLDMLAAFGGTASLFLGFSFMSAIEFFYYFTIRQFVSWLQLTFVCTSKKRKMCCNSKKKSVSPTNMMPSLLGVMKDTIKTWCSMSSVHGVKYIVHPQRHQVERLLWLVIFLVFLVTCMQSALNLSESFYKKAVLIETHISQVELEIQRPAISICNRHQYKNQSALSEFGSEHYVSLSNYYTHILYPSETFKINNAHTYLENSYCVNNSRCPPLEDSVNQLYKKQRDLKYQQFKCINRGINGNIIDGGKCLLPFAIDTETGPCFIFYSSQTRYINRSLKDFKNGWIFKIAFRKEESYEIYVHKANEVPTTEMLVYGFLSNPYTVTEEILRPLETVTIGNELRELSPEERGCRFKDENTLFIHREYSYTACIAECRSALMMKLCGCLHPMSPKIRNAKVCSHAGLRCLQRYTSDLLRLNDGNTYKCGCLRECEDTKFESILLNTGSLPKLSLYSLEFLKPREQNRRRIMAGQIEHFVAVGGIISLFLGASFMSLLEVPYFLFIRLSVNFYTSVVKWMESRRNSEHHRLFRRMNTKRKDRDIHHKNVSLSQRNAWKCVDLD